jgi:hypothetical protein
VSGEDTKPNPAEAGEQRFAARADGLVDVVEQEGHLEFLVIGSRGGFSATGKLRAPDGAVLVPPPRETLGFSPVRLNTVRTIWNGWGEGSAPSAFEMLRDFLGNAAYLPEPRSAWLDLLAAWVLHTYVQELVAYSPILYMQGPPGRGKTRLGKALTYTSFRGWHTNALRQATLIRMAEDLNATMFFDLYDVESLSRGENMDLMLGRFEKGIGTMRVNDPSAGPFRGMRMHQVFGPTILASNRPLASPPLLSRCIPLTMPDASGARVGDPPTAEEALPIRERLTVWRAKLLGAGALPPVERATVGRLGDITVPLLQVVAAAAPERMVGVVEHVTSLADEARAQRSLSKEAKFVRALLDGRTDVKNGKLPVEFVTDRVNNGTDLRHKMSPQSVGKQLKGMGIQTRIVNGRSKIVYDEERITTLAGYWLSDEAEAD